MKEQLQALLPTTNIAQAPSLAYLRTSKGKPYYFIENERCLGLHLADLSLSEQTIDQLLAVAGKDLQVLHVARNNFKKLHLDLPALEYLELSGNKNLQALHLGNMPKLQKLVANDCALAEVQLPDELPQLKSLELARNQLVALSLPKQLGSLRFLDLAKNQLKSLTIPDGCARLEYVFALDNELEHLIFEGPLPVLNILHLEKNKLSELPLLLVESKGLEALYLHGNELKDISDEIIGNENTDSSSAILSYLQAKKDNTLLPLYEAKLILVGNGEVGKTSICIKLRDPNAPLPTKEQRTPGLDVYPYIIKDLATNITSLDKPIDFRLNLWDFGGQGVYREVQQLFCRKKSAYLYVISYDDEPTQEDYIDWHYWLLMVKAYGYDADANHQSPILVVKNKKDLATTPTQRRVAKIIGHIGDEFPEVQILEDSISCETCDNLERLQKGINQLLSNLGEDVFKRNSYPQDWLSVKTAIEERSEPYLSFDQYFEKVWKPLIKSESDKEDQEKAKEWLKILDRIGTILYFPENPILADWIIIKPQWVQEALFKIYKHPRLLEDDGEAGESVFAEIWPNALERSKLIALTLQFKLAYPIVTESNKKRYYFPALFKREVLDIPDYVIKRATKQVKLVAKPFIPAGTLNKLVVDLNLVIYKDYRRKNDVLFHNAANDAYARCEENWEKHEVLITLYGDKVGILYKMIIDALEANLASIRSTLLISQLFYEEQTFYNNKWIDVDIIKDIPGAKEEYSSLSKAEKNEGIETEESPSANYNTGNHYNQLVKKLKENKVVLFLGTGVSAFTTGGESKSTWKGLLRNGIEVCSAEHPQKCNDKWVKMRNDQLDTDDTEEWISVAEFITQVLKEKNYFHTWLQESVGTLPNRDKRLIESIGKLNRQIYTTNYDSLLKTVLSQDIITNLEDDKIQQVISGKRENTIVHLHGHYDYPNSVILGVRSYSNLTQKSFFQHLQSVVYTSQHVLFVGFGSGLEDPNFGKLLEWAKSTGAEHPHYRLVSKADEYKNAPDVNIRNIVYGDKYADLVTFIEQLVKDI